MGGLIDANTISHDHVVITLPSVWLGSAWLRRFHSPTVQSDKGLGEGPLRAPPTPGCCSRWTPS